MVAGGRGHGLGDRAHAADRVSPNTRLAVHLAEYVVQQHVRGTCAVRAREIADDRIEAKERLDRIGLEPPVEHVACGTAQQMQRRRETVVSPKRLADRREVAEPAQRLAQIAKKEIGWR